MAAATAPYFGGRVPRHQRHPVRTAQITGGHPQHCTPSCWQLHRCGRRRPIHLRLAWRHPGQPEKTAHRFPQPSGHQAGAKLPLHQRHFESGQQRHWPQPQALPQTLVERFRRRRTRAGGGRRPRRARGRAHRGAHPKLALGYQHPGLRHATPRVARLCSAVPRQPPSARVGAGVSQSPNPLQGVGRHQFF